MKNPDNVITSEKHDNGWYDISTTEYYFNTLFSWLPANGDESGNVKSGRWRVYGKGTNMDWQNGLPTGGEGTESIDLNSLLSLFESTNGVKEPYEITEALTNKYAEKVVDFLDKTTETAKRIAESIEVTNKSTQTPIGITCSVCPRRIISTDSIDFHSGKIDTIYKTTTIDEKKPRN